MSKPTNPHWISLTITSFIITASISFNAVSPIVLGGMADHLGYSKQLIGWVVATNTYGVATAGLIVAMILPRFGILNLSRVGLSILIIAEIVSAYITDPTTMLIVRFIAGFCGGLTYASALSAFASLAQPVRGFSTYTIVFCVFTFITMLILPQLIRWYHLKGAFFMLALLNVLALASSKVLHPFNSRNRKHKLDASVFKLLQNPRIFATVFAYFALQSGAVAIWAFLERMGNEKGLDPTFIGLVLSLTGFCGLVGAIIVKTLRDRINVLKAVLLGFPFLPLGIIILYAGAVPITYVFGILFFATAWGFVLPLYQGVQASYDPEGRIVSLGAFTNMLGQATGPALASILLGTAAYANVAWISLSMFLISIIAIVPAILGLLRDE